nr:hypothetical protein [Tanacetum cinerariifolium]
MPMDPLDPYVQLVMKAPHSPDYIPGPEAPPSPDYIPRPETPPSPDYIPGREYPEYLPPADDVLPTKEQPLPAAVSPTAESPTSEGDNDADDDGDDLSEDDADDEEEDESSDSEEEEEEHLAPTVLAPALYSSVSAFEETEPFEEGETAATPPPFGYRVAARISVQPHILMPFHSESEVERLLAIPTPPLSSVLPTSYPLPPLLMPLPIFTPLSTSSFPFPSSLPSTSGSESIPEVDIPIRKRARFTTPTGRYEVGESFVAAAARQIRPALTIADRRRSWTTASHERVEKYIGGVPDTIHDSVKATKPKTIQEAIEFATKLMDKRICDDVENKQKFEGTSGNNQNQPQQNKRQNTGRAYAGGNDNAQARVYMVGNAGANPDNVVADKAKSKGKQLEDVPVVQEFLEVFP